jgi:GTPase SAR1 family protein
MGRCFIQLVTGPAGSGKSTYCSAIQQHCATLGKMRRRTVHVANLDPAAENFAYDLSFDIRDLITVEDVMEELGLGPNGALIYCMEYLLQNMDWLEDQLDKFDDDEYLVIDCPGQIELYTHAPIIKRVIDQMTTWGHGSRMCSVFVVDATFVCDAPKFISGSLLSLSAMIALELPHINILSKTDLVDEEKVASILDVESASVLWQREEYNRSVEEDNMMRSLAKVEKGSESTNSVKALREDRLRIAQRRRKQNRLTEAICSLLDDYSMVSFVPLNITDEESIDHVLSHVDHTIQYGEDLEIRGADENDFGDDE